MSDRPMSGGRSETSRERLARLLGPRPWLCRDCGEYVVGDSHPCPKTGRLFQRSLDGTIVGIQSAP
jgi:hypothetical protein